jgi:hypothetical protein
MLEDILISALITSAVILIIRWAYKKQNISATPFGCLFGCAFVFYLAFCFVHGKREANKNANKTKVVLVSSGETIRVDNASFTGKDTVYIKRYNVHFNDTGKDLVTYSVKYTRSGYDKDEKPLGTIIKPNQYFYWFPDRENSYMFCTPPSSFSIRVNNSFPGRQMKDVEYVYVEFLDYADNVKDKVRFHKE